MIRMVKGERQARLAFIDELKARVGQADRAVEESVAEIIRNVKEGGDEAVQNYSRQFDGWAPERLELTRQEMEEIAQACAPEFLEALRRAAENIRIFHARQKQQSRIDPMGGIITGQRVRGLHRAGVYVPGGTAGYPSSVLMNVIPAQVAEVGEIVMATPPGRTGRTPTSLPRPLPPGWTGCSSWAAPRRSRPWPTARRRCPRWTKLWGRGTFSWLPPRSSFTAWWTLT